MYRETVTDASRIEEKHPFYVEERSDQAARPKPVGHEDLNTNWVGAGHLKIGDKIKQADGTTGVVANVVTIQQTQEMFNLTVSGAHTFYVGTNGWLVHNEGLPGKPCGGITEAIIRTAMKDAPLQTQQKAGVSLPKVQEIVDGVRNGTLKWEDLPPIKVDNGIIVDGNHRYVAGRTLGLEPKVQPWSGGRPSRVVPWDSIPVDPKNWGK